MWMAERRQGEATRLGERARLAAGGGGCTVDRDCSRDVASKNEQTGTERQ